MSNEEPLTPPGGPRMSTGNPDLDRMLDGGLLPRRPYLLVGPSGTGKTTLSLQFLCEGVRRGERVLFVTVEEPPNEILWNHRRLMPLLAKVDVFDAIPDVMRFERTPFKDIASVRSSLPFERVDPEIRKTPELTSVEVTISALEQMLRTEVQRRSYSRVVVDSLTALQYFCMKGYEPALGAQSFLRFLSDLRVTTLLTVEAPLEDVETPERMLARGEVRLFRWELDGVTVRAVGVEKFRGSSHDVRLHPYRIGGHGIDINLGSTISRDTQQVVAEPEVVATPTGEPPIHEPTPVELLEQEVRDLLLAGGDPAPIRVEVGRSLEAARQGEMAEAAVHLTKALADASVPPEEASMLHRTLPAPAEAALARILARAEATRVGVAPARLPEPPILVAQLSRVIQDVFPSAETTPAPLPEERVTLEGPEPVTVPPSATSSSEAAARELAPQPEPLAASIVAAPLPPPLTPPAPAPPPQSRPTPSATPPVEILPSAVAVAPAPAEAEKHPSVEAPHEPVPAEVTVRPPPPPPEAPAPSRPTATPAELVAPGPPPSSTNPRSAGPEPVGATPVPAEVAPPLPAPKLPAPAAAPPPVPPAASPVPAAGVSLPAQGVAPSAASRSPRAEPPPLPTRPSLPPAAPAARAKSPTAEPASAPAPVAAAARVPGVVSPTASTTAPLPTSPPLPAEPSSSPSGGPPVPTPGPSPVAAAVSAPLLAPPPEPGAATTRKRKRTPSTGRRRSAASAPPPSGSAGEGTPAPAGLTGPEAPVAAGATVAAATKPKRKVVRKKKAPSVVGATPGPVPAGAYGTEPPPPADAPPREGT